MTNPIPNFEPNNLRKRILKMAYVGNSVHVGCAFSLVEIVSVLYSKILDYDRNECCSPKRDFLVLSKGHGVMALYACLGEIGWLEQEHFDRYFSDGSLLHGLGEAKIPGIEVCGGSLGHGLPIAIGMAFGLKRANSQRKVFCIVGDGEINEGTIWEGLLFAAHHKLNNFTVVVDANGFQAMGDVSSIIDLEPIKGKFESFGFRALECNGHDVVQLEKCFKEHGKDQRPLAVVARTIKGKGVSFMENNNQWHYLRLNPQTLERALCEVESGGHDA